MNILSRISTAFISKAKAVGDYFPGNWTVLSGGPDNGVNERNLLTANTEWVYVAVDKVASSVASVKFKVKQYKRNGDDQEVFEGALVDFLETPGAGYTGKDFIYLNTVYKELTGNSFWEILKTRSGFIDIAPIIPTVVAPNISGGKLIGYKVNDGARERTIKAEQMLHDRYIDPAKPWWGAGRLQKIARWVDTGNFANEFLRRFFLNGATFGGFIETEEESEERMKLIKMGLQNDHAGVQNAHKMGVLPKGAKYTKVTANMGEIEMGATDDRYRDKILSTFGVPKTLVGLTTEVNRASAEAAEYVYARYTIKPIVDDLIEFLNVKVAPLLDPSGKTYFDYEDFIPENEEIEIKERESALNKQPYKTVNEVRADVGLPPVQGGDVIYGTAGQVPLGEPQPAPQAPADQKPTDTTPTPAKSLPRGVLGRVRKAAQQERSDARLDAFLERMVTVTNAIGTTTDAKDAADHKEFVGRVDSHRDKLERAVREFNGRQQRDILGRLHIITKDFPAGNTKDVSRGDLMNMDTEVAAMVDVVSPILGSLLTEQAIAEYEAQGFPGFYASGDVFTKQVALLAAKRLAKSYNTTTAKLLVGKINEGMQAGESLQQIVKRVQEVYDYSDAIRAKAVAHTESFYIANKGNQEAYRQSGVVKTIRWYTAEDEMVCPHCAPMQGRQAPVDGSYYKKGETTESGLVLDYRSMDVPPLHTNCRCFIRPGQITVGE
jgi:HK97 family phage portal protein